MRFQLRDYTLVDGRLDDFVREWREHVLPLRLALGFSIVGPWIERDTNRFVWVLGYDGDIEAAEEAYYASEERRAMTPDPARLIAEIRQTWLEAP
jgi:hypothetical protein